MSLAIARRLVLVALSGAVLALAAIAAPGIGGELGHRLLFSDEEPGYLGVTLDPADELIVSEVLPETAARNVGLEVGDKIVAIAGRKVNSYEGLIGVLKEHPPGTKVTLVVVRGDRKLEKKVVLGARGEPQVKRLVRIEQDVDDEHAHAQVLQKEKALRQVLGEIVPVEEDVPTSGYLGVYLSGDEADPVVSSVIPDTPAAKAGLQPGDRLLAVDGERVSTGAAATAAIQARRAGAKVRLDVARGDKKLRLKVVLGARPEEQGPVGLALPPEPVRDEEARRRLEERIEQYLQEKRSDREDRPAPETTRRTEIERVLSELQRRGTEESRRWADVHDERMKELGEALQERSRTLERTFRDLRTRAGTEALEGPGRERLERFRQELERWGGDRARVLRENARRMRQVENEHLQRLEEALKGLRRRGEEAKPRARASLEEARRRLTDVEQGFQELLDEHVPDVGPATLDEVRQAIGGLRREVEGLRSELQALREALRKIRAER